MSNVEQGPKCHIWIGPRFGEDGYGVFRVDKEHVYLAHRLMYAHTTKKWPRDHAVAQTCGDKGCVHPKHLQRGR